ncbi:type 2 lantibiotic biosynthesis protein [Adhaeribacter aerolatus]|uniref:Type 2 lantibiotic biosynthesis protein n=1 Tax=Adhaeribacter aerolatus TaxID=670289 RepID=A0A512AV54_9BACT|nr:type 2 lanthipeptide synthetase LanM family protein [Adhaeribacter aerolatus]GEO03592.1 type 2 lantibiotic biosynthesis protein [Adhaeribacter aerolatus]
MKLNTNCLLKALTLKERASFVRNINLAPQPEGEATSKLAEKWKMRYPFSEGEYFGKKLQQYNLTEAQFNTLTSAPLNILKDFIPYNQIGLQRKLSLLNTGISENYTFFSEKYLSRVPVAGFLDFVEPLIREAVQRLTADIAAKVASGTWGQAFAIENIKNHLVDNIPAKLYEMVNRTLVLEMNIARLNNELTGETPAERFNSFIQLIRTPERRQALAEEYPVLIRQISDYLDSWYQNSTLFLERLHTDWPQLQSVFGIAENDIVNKIITSAGDRHRGGQTVTIVTFASGKKVVYKPRPLAVESHFQELLQWYNQKGVTNPFKILIILNREIYGWVEFIEHTTCQTKEELQQYYHRYGSLLAILYSINATDFHLENIIAAGEHPVLIDIESLFHPNMVHKNHGVYSDIFNQLELSVLKVQLLPMRLYLNDQNEGIDVGGLNDSAGKLSPMAAPVWIADATDEMKLVQQQIVYQGSKNVALLHGEKSDFFQYADQIEAGFRHTYQIIRQSKTELLAAGSILDMFANDHIRVMYRQTATYTQILYASFHPDFLRDAYERDILFDKLWEEAPGRPDVEKVIDAEQVALHKMDIPVFVTKPNAKNLWLDDNQCVPDFYEATGLEQVCYKIENLSAADCEKQCWFIRASLSSSAPVEQHHTAAVNYLAQELTSEATAAELIAAAKKIGDRLQSLAFITEDNANWIGLVLRGKNYDINPLAMDLYSGLPGVTLFLAYLGYVTGEPKYTCLAQQSLNTIISTADDYMADNFVKRLGMFDGWIGIIYLYTHLGILWQRADLLDQAEVVTRFLDPYLPAGKDVDIVTGSAGMILSLLALYRVRPSEATLNLAIKLGRHLADNAIAMPTGKAWKIEGQQPLAGFAHGNAGIAYALSKLYLLTRQEQFKILALDGIQYERTLFVPERNNWLDLRKASTSTPESHNDMVAWCTGAAGIGLARLKMLDFLHDNQVVEEIEAAIQTTTHQGFGRNHSLCHGDFGNLELLADAAAIFEDEALQAKTGKITQVLLQSIQEHGLLCGTAQNIEIPGFMTGIAGIGYQMLRLSGAASLPSILLLDPPVTN